jgi:hypothetical protein
LTANYRNVGAVAELFDISCFYNTSFFDKVSDDAITLWSSAPSSLTISEMIKALSYVKNPIVLGEHYFVTNPVTGTGLSPRWDFTSHAFKRNHNAFVVGNKVGDLAAPTGSQDIDWLYLTAAQGKLANEVYRTDTRLGQPPASVSFHYRWYQGPSLTNGR